MDAMQKELLIARGVKQGCLISCNTLSTDIRSLIQDSRSIKAHRGKPVLDDHKILVLSQDCDISQPTDHYIELLVIKKLPEKKEDPLVQNNRNYKKLQIPIDDGYWFCDAELISIIPKKNLEQESFTICGYLEGDALDVLIDWRVGRYNRRPFPDQFNQELLIGYIKQPDNGLGNYLTANKDDIIDLFVYVSPMDIEHADEYVVSLTALVKQECTEDKLEEIRTMIFKHCKILHEQENTLKMMQIDDNYKDENSYNFNADFALKMEDFTMLDAMYLTRLNLDYLCYDFDDTK